MDQEIREKLLVLIGLGPLSPTLVLQVMSDLGYVPKETQSCLFAGLDDGTWKFNSAMRLTLCTSPNKSSA